MRREWIEMRRPLARPLQMRSPSMRREWIEIRHTGSSEHQDLSPSMRREWIEISIQPITVPPFLVSLHAEGVD